MALVISLEVRPSPLRRDFLRGVLILFLLSTWLPVEPLETLLKLFLFIGDFFIGEFLPIAEELVSGKFLEGVPLLLYFIELFAFFPFVPFFPLASSVVYCFN